MKKVSLILGFALLAVVSCAENSEELNDSQVSENQEVAVDMSDFYLYTEDLTNGKASAGKNAKVCYSMANLNRQLSEDDKLYDKMYSIEKNVRKFINSKKPDGAGNGNGNGGGGGDTGGGTDPVDDGLGSINIPVVVHVIYSNSQENISDAQIASQIAVLNDDLMPQTVI